MKDSRDRGRRLHKVFQFRVAFLRARHSLAADTDWEVQHLTLGEGSAYYVHTN